MTYVMHSFMDAAAVAPAWAHLQAGTTPADPAEVEAWERLRACAYTMAHPETGELVPACAQHGVLDPAENERLAQQLPMSAASPCGSPTTAGYCGDDIEIP